VTAALAATCSSPELPFGSEERPTTLDELVSGVWEILAAHPGEEAVMCPVCGGQMRREYGAGALPIGGRCADCSSTLS
jgi:hypothetical protein